MEPEHDFTLVLNGESELTTEIENALFEAGCDDATLSFQMGTVCLDFTRAAASRENAVASALADVHKAGFEVELVREPNVAPCPLGSAKTVAV